MMTAGASANGTVITGHANAQFNVQFTVGDLFKFEGTGEERKVTAIGSATSMTVSEPFALAAVANTY